MKQCAKTLKGAVTHARKGTNNQNWRIHHIHTSWDVCSQHTLSSNWTPVCVCPVKLLCNSMWSRYILIPFVNPHTRYTVTNTIITRWIAPWMYWMPVPMFPPTAQRSELNSLEGRPCRRPSRCTSAPLPGRGDQGHTCTERERKNWWRNGRVQWKRKGRPHPCGNGLGLICMTHQSVTWI